MAQTLRALLPRPAVVMVAGAVGVVLGALSIAGDRVGMWRGLTLLGNMAAPWALGAAVAGRVAATIRRGVVAGTLALLVGLVTYYGYYAVRGGYVLRAVDLAWVVVALTIGPLMGWCGAVLRAGRGRAATGAAAALSAVLVAEAVWTAYDRRSWRWNFAAEPHRLIDLGVVVGLVIVAAVIPLWWVRDRRRLPTVYGAVVLVGLVGSTAFSLLQDMVI